MGRRTRSACQLATAALLTSVALTGCSDDEPDAGGRTSSQSIPAGGETRTTERMTSVQPTESEPTTSDATSTTTSTAEPTSTAAQRARQAQIAPAELPGFNDEWVWDRAKSKPGTGQRPPPVCSVSNLVAIGGVLAHRTDYRSSLDPTARAVQVTAVFPDEETAVTAEQVLSSWHASCERRLMRRDREDVRVPPMTQVTTDVGAGQQWLTTYKPVPGQPDLAWFNAEGYVRSGDMITYLVIRSAGQDYNYPRGRQPMQLAVKQAARELSELN